MKKIRYIILSMLMAVCITGAVTNVKAQTKLRTIKESTKYIPKKASKKKKSKRKTAIKLKLKQDFLEGQYGDSTCADSDNIFYYVRKNMVHVICRNGRVLYDYRLKSNGKAKLSKKIKLCKYTYWGGIYHAANGSNYVAVGYSNIKRNDSKVVIKVLKYSSSWKLQKTCNIKSDGEIVTPFEAGNMRMVMRGTNLYMVTSRIMYSGHQANINFMIDTKTMKYQEKSDCYVSHSFNQYVRFDANNLYLVNHGDAFDRGVNLAVIKNHGKENQENTVELLPFKAKGEIGNNYTGIKLGGLELTKNSIITAGISVPQDYTVAGVTGNKTTYLKNVFITITDKNTLQSKVKWLTTYNPKKSKITMGEVRTVKLSENAIAIMYSTSLKSKQTLHYIVVNDQGNVICRKNYKNMEFTASSQPILHKGGIYWVDAKYTYKKVSWYYEVTEHYYSYKIPAVQK